MTEHKIPEILNALGFTAVDADSDVGKDAALILHALGFTDGYVATPEARASARGAVTRLVSRLDTLERQLEDHARLHAGIVANLERERDEAQKRLDDWKLAHSGACEAKRIEQAEARLRAAEEDRDGWKRTAEEGLKHLRAFTQDAADRLAALAGVQGPALIDEEREKREKDWGDEYAAEAGVQAPAEEDTP